MSATDLSNRSGRLRDRVTLQVAVQTADDAGGFTRAWQDVAELWAEIAPLSGHERLDALQLTGFVTHNLTLRYRADVTADKRFVAGARVFNIRSVVDEGNARRFLHVLAEEGAAT